jgi:hypothetical protein
VTPQRRRVAHVAGRQRDYAQEYSRRRARAAARGHRSFYTERVARGAERGLSRSQAAGHRRAAEPSPRRLSAARTSTFSIFTASGERLDERVNRAEAKRLGRYYVEVRRLERGEIGPSQFRRKVSRWAPVAGHKLAADPNVALALTATTAPSDWRFDYRHGRAGRAS